MFLVNLKNIKLFTILCFCLVNIFPNKVFANDFDSKYKKILKKYSLYTDSVINDFYSGGLIGNGLLGASIYKQSGDTLCWEVGRTDVCDHRQENNPILYTDCRLPIGKFLIPIKKSTSSMLMDLYECEVSGSVKEEKKILFKWKTMSPAMHNVFIIELEGKKLPDIIFKPDISISPRYTFKEQAYRRSDKLVGYTANPAPILYSENDFFICKQPLKAGGEYSTVWRINTYKNKKVLIASIGYSQTRTDTEKDAINDIKLVLNEGFKNVKYKHKDWWHKFYSKSYVCVSEDKFNALFWKELYKLGSATRSNRNPIDLMGPWFHNQTPWPAIWWNLNIQLTYSPMFVVNHCELVVPLLNMLDKNIDNLKKNIPSECPYPAIAIGRSSSYNCQAKTGKEHGLILWTLFYYWKYCTYTNNKERLKNNMFPLLKLAVNYYRHLLFKGNDGYLHLPMSHSPEYGNAEDCNFELSLLRWGCETLVEIDNIFDLNDSLLPEWKNILTNLVPYPTDEDGFLIGNNVKLRSGHRHYSHLLMLYPLQNFPLDTYDNIQLAKKSIDYWLGFKINAYYCGYTYTGASSMCTLMGDGESSHSYMNALFKKYPVFKTLYKEGEAGPVFETPMSALASFTEMLLSSNGQTIKIMPAIPKVWEEVEFNRLLADNGFEVSAKRHKGQTEKIIIKSLYGGTCKVYCDIPKEYRKIICKGNIIISEKGNNELILSIPKGQSITIKRK